MTILNLIHSRFFFFISVLRNSINNSLNFVRFRSSCLISWNLIEVVNNCGHITGKTVILILSFYEMKCISNMSRPISHARVACSKITSLEWAAEKKTTKTLFFSFNVFFFHDVCSFCLHSNGKLNFNFNLRRDQSNEFDEKILMFKE